jgi:hypothetical protein
MTHPLFIIFQRSQYNYPIDGALNDGHGVSYQTSNKSFMTWVV